MGDPFKSGAGWVTNDPSVAAALKAADAAYMKARAAAAGLPLALKLEVYRAADRARLDAYRCARMPAGQL